MFCARFLRLLAVCFLSLALSNQASAASIYGYGFQQITNNGGVAVADQLRVDVSDAGEGKVLFKFTNSADGYSSAVIAQIYWDDDDSLLTTPLELHDESTSVGVSMDLSESASPSNLPGGDTVADKFEADFSVGRENQGGVSNGVDPGEMVGFLLLGDVDKVCEALENATLRIGMHVQSIPSIADPDNDDSISEGFITSVPEPSSIALLSLGLLGLGRRTRNRAS